MITSADMKAVAAALGIPVFDIAIAPFNASMFTGISNKVDASALMRIAQRRQAAESLLQESDE
jgi:hypothetical protein